eukprot:CAMPEP_0198309052 /NCGR_PEP_ID=MMETSP1450-20131203/1514_1 /TAXON_ID=753684 ORGANISM="Madagascaria erythrocladiodes, Strain CCMP3234" /NCGR_SAMPLE_ID=MMETSP1450 /ASSEMBLY_ACC=CAM_ASM_001115 /LENGTH=370 /DNA_ID=CAMNT_0044011773 /DNA_START=88 /DNA_END=1200 /DNA_ORIENTATION=-
MSWLSRAAVRVLIVALLVAAYVQLFESRWENVIMRLVWNAGLIYFYFGPNEYNTGNFLSITSGVAIGNQPLTADHARRLAAMRAPMDKLRPFTHATEAAARKTAASDDQKSRCLSYHDSFESSDGQQIDVVVVKPRHVLLGGSRKPHTLIYYHGGGWVIGSAHGMDVLHPCEQHGAQVFSIAYRLAPEWRFPTGFNDCFDALKHYYNNADKYNIDKSRLSVGGASAGGNLAAAVAIAARDAKIPLASQVLLFPVTDVNFAFASSSQFYDVILTPAFMLWFRNKYVTPENYNDWRVSPLRAADLSGVAKAYILACGSDVLHDDATNYAAALDAAGVAVEMVDIPNAPHACNLPLYSEYSAEFGPLEAAAYV